jgi:hypothetical protein
MLKKVVAVAAFAGAAALSATPASAAILCADVYAQVNETVVAQTVCTPA